MLHFDSLTMLQLLKGKYEIFTFIFLHIVLYIDIRLVRELMSRCSEFSLDALEAEYEYPTLFQQLRISIGCEGSQRSNMTIRAQPRAYGSEPWYDFVEVAVNEDRNGVQVQAHYAAQVICFVDLSKKGQNMMYSLHHQGSEESSSDSDVDEIGAEKSFMLAFVKFYINALSPAERQQSVSNYQWNDLKNIHRMVPLSIVREDPNINARYGLIDTEQIQQGLWMQQDFETPDRYRVLKF